MTEREKIAHRIGEPLTLHLRNRATGRRVGEALIGSVERIAGRHVVRLSAEDQRDIISTGDLVATIRGPMGEMPEFEIRLTFPIPLGADAINVDLGWITVEDER